MDNSYHAPGEGIVYSDSLIEMTADGILFKRYYFPYGRRRVLFADIECIVAQEPSPRNGKYRLWGSGDMRTWFPLDWRRASRPKIFSIRLRHRWKRIAFTVEDAEAVAGILRQRQLLVD